MVVGRDRAQRALPEDPVALDPRGDGPRRTLADTRTTNDVQQVQTLALMTSRSWSAAPDHARRCVLLAIRQDGPLSLLLVAVAPVLMLFIGLLIRRMRPLFRQNAGAPGCRESHPARAIAGIRVIRAFVRDARELDASGMRTRTCATPRSRSVG